MADHRATMAELAKANGWKRGIELGLGSGLLLQRFLGLGIEMIGVDIGARADRAQSVRDIVAGAKLANARIIWDTTRRAARHVPDDWADFIFIDAAHSYEAVRSDIKDWLPKVKKGGFFSGHDYHPNFPGVIRAVGEAFGSEIDVLDGWIWARKSAQC